MKKMLLVMLLFISTTLSCYGKYVKISNAKNENILYGKMKYKDFISGNAYMKNIKTGNSCSGFWFSAFDASTKAKNAYVFGKLECTDGKIFEMNLNQKLKGTAVDQYKNNYDINVIKRKEYKSCTKIKGKCKSVNQI